MAEKQEFLPIDTTDAFDGIFQGKDKFSSWEEFITLFEEFQKLSLTVFKPRSGTCVNYVNEKRVTHKIPDKFVYQTVKMICIHFGTPRKREETKRRHSRYVGLNCEAFVKLSYKKGFLHITDKNLVHSNHGQEESEEGMDSVIRKIRPVSYNDELDLIITQVVDQNKVFEFKKGDLRWRATLFQVQDADPRLQHMTQRMLKKRVQFLMERYLVNSGGRSPLSNDHMGIILHRMIEAKKMSDFAEHIPQKRGRKKRMVMADGPTPVKRGRGRPRKVAESYEEYLKDKAKYLKNRSVNKFEEDEDEDGAGDGTIDAPDFLDGSFLDESSGSGSSTNMEKEMAAFLSYWKSRDEDERKLRWKEMALRREEMEVRRREMELQKEKFEFERTERLLLVELLKTQGQLVNSARVHAQIQTEGEETTEYIVLSDGQVEHITTGKTGHL
ncbi:uncharacterized protein LOC101859347 [Aplysia californica]|uniref:Uncharacterized protein LOC101859347 n=1 Tax=Aplysia californica TaxID=6500 RepID=A0ABM1A567_APLCA|nr:uncharacterized protein LOC101859347 [Aplysia californica]XP_005103791.1 uncharacterized protein LOC101859347 [Aplysia californica]XP_012941036.1 uncharacterized protein LOC101859347 [Aplysia californica]